MRICTSSLDISWENITENASKIIDIIDFISKNDLDLIIFPELSLYGFSMNGDFDQNLILKVLNIIRRHADEKNVNIIFGYPYKSNNKIYNVAEYYDSSEKKSHIYKKSKLFKHAGEDKTYSNSQNSIIIKEKLAISICFDLRFSEIFIESRARVDLLVNIANWPNTRISHYHDLIKSRSIECQAFHVGVNRSGHDPNVKYHNGFTCFYDYSGKELKAQERFEFHGELNIFDINLKEITNYRDKFRFYE